jgi:hypothetical protein
LRGLGYDRVPKHSLRDHEAERPGGLVEQTLALQPSRDPYWDRLLVERRPVGSKPREGHLLRLQQAGNQQRLVRRDRDRLRLVPDEVLRVRHVLLRLQVLLRGRQQPARLAQLVGHPQQMQGRPPGSGLHRPHVLVRDAGLTGQALAGDCRVAFQPPSQERRARPVVALRAGGGVEDLRRGSGHVRPVAERTRHQRTSARWRLADLVHSAFIVTRELSRPRASSGCPRHPGAPVDEDAPGGPRCMFCQGRERLRRSGPPVVAVRPSRPAPQYHRRRSWPSEPDADPDEHRQHRPRGGPAGGGEVLRVAAAVLRSGAVPSPSA